MPESRSAWDIADLAKAAGVSSRTIRYYGELGIVHSRGRGPGGRRRFGPDALERLRFIDRLKKLGLTLEEIRRLNAAFERGRTLKMLEHLETLLLTHLDGVRQRRRDLLDLEKEMKTYLERIRSKRRTLHSRKSA